MRPGGAGTGARPASRRTGGVGRQRLGARADGAHSVGGAARGAIETPAAAKEVGSTSPSATRRILGHHGLHAKPPVRARAQPRRSVGLPAGARGASADRGAVFVERPKPRQRSRAAPARDVTATRSSSRSGTGLLSMPKPTRVIRPARPGSRRRSSPRTRFRRPSRLDRATYRAPGTGPRHAAARRGKSGRGLGHALAPGLRVWRLDR